MPNILVGLGDTFVDISRRVYGVETQSGAIQRANPGAKEPLQAGTYIFAPTIIGRPQNKPHQVPASSPSEFAVTIEGERFRHWVEVEVTRSIDRPSTVVFRAPFNPSDPAVRDRFRPFSFKPVTVTAGGNPLFSGVMTTPVPNTTPQGRTVTVPCYSQAAVLWDCPAPASSYPIEFDGQELKEIAASMLEPFGIPLDYRAAATASAFERVAASPSQSVASFLAGLARQQSAILTDTKEGGLLIWNSVPAGTPVARLKLGESPVISVLPRFQAQEYYSHITGLEPVIPGLGGAQFTVKNIHYDQSPRPMTFTSTDSQEGALPESVRARAGRMFGNIASYDIAVSSALDPRGNLWEPNTTITLDAPGAMVYGEYEFIIRTVSTRRSKTGESAVLNVIMPGSFSGQIPERLPWQS